MKKMLLSAALIMAAFTANAQVEVGYLDGTAHGIQYTSKDDGTTPLEAGHVFCTTDHLTVIGLYDDNYVKPGMKKGTVSVNGEELTIPENVVQGNNNGKGNSAAKNDFASSIGMSMFQITSNTTGYVYAIISASGNKNYVVYEDGVNAGNRLPYVFAMENTNDVEGAPATFAYDLSKIEGSLMYVDFGDGTGDYYVDDNFAITQASEMTGAKSTSTTGNGVIKFKAYADIPYQIFATGSKITLGAVVFDTTGDATITTSNGNTLLEAGQLPGQGGGAGIAGVEVKDEVDPNAPVYNIAGQRVNKNAKGLVIVNGKKVLRK